MLFFLLNIITLQFLNKMIKSEESSSIGFITVLDTNLNGPVLYKRANSQNSKDPKATPFKERLAVAL